MPRSLCADDPSDGCVTRALPSRVRTARNDGAGTRTVHAIAVPIGYPTDRGDSAIPPECSHPMEFRILGPLYADAGTGSGPALLGQPLLQSALAVLLLRANRTCSRPFLIDALWGSEPPAAPEAALRVCISRLRSCLGDCAGGCRRSGRRAAARQSSGSSAATSCTSGRENWMPTSSATWPRRASRSSTSAMQPLPPPPSCRRWRCGAIRLCLTCLTARLWPRMSRGWLSTGARSWTR